MEPGQGCEGGIQKQFVGFSENENLMAPVESAAIDQNPAPDSSKDIFLPAASVRRIMKEILPSDAKVTKEAKEAMQACGIQFIQWVMHNARTHCQKETRTLVTAEDIIFTLKELGFDDYDRILTLFLKRYRESKEGKQSTNDEGPNVMNPFGQSPPGMFPPVTFGFIPQYMPHMPAPGPSGVPQEGVNINHVNEVPSSSSSGNTRPV